MKSIKMPLLEPTDYVEISWWLYPEELVRSILRRRKAMRESLFY